MIELLKELGRDDIIIGVCAVLLAFLLWFRFYWRRNQGEFVELQMKNKYRLKQKTWFYSGTVPSINESKIHTPDVLITRCMVLVWTTQNNDYYGFKIVCNKCLTDGEAARHEQRVYYKRDLFDNLEKIEIG